MTTVRMTPAQKEKLDRVAKVLSSIRRHRVSQGEAVEVLAEFAMRNRHLLYREAPDPIAEDDPFFDSSLTFDMGRTDERTHDRLLYGR